MPSDASAAYEVNDVDGIELLMLTLSGTSHCLLSTHQIEHHLSATFLSERAVILARP